MCVCLFCLHDKLCCNYVTVFRYLRFVTVPRFHDAGYYFWKLSVQCLDLVSGENAQGEPDNEMLEKFHDYQEKAEIYHLYHSIQRYTVSE